MSDPNKRLGRSFFDRPTEDVAIGLISTILWRVTPDGMTAGRIVETEAYLDSSDRASHAAWSKRGQDVMQRAPGTIYIYRSYGMHWMFNIVAHAPELVGAVLVRAVEPLEGIELMEQRRGMTDIRQLCSGPGKVCQAFAIDDSLHKVDLATSNEIWISNGEPHFQRDIVVGERIGITKSPDLPLRFFEAGNRFVSAHRRGVPLSSGMLPSP
jgi:DNA-3-methyladenine glycosylase